MSTPFTLPHQTKDQAQAQAQVRRSLLAPYDIDLNLIPAHMTIVHHPQQVLPRFRTHSNVLTTTSNHTTSRQLLEKPLPLNGIENRSGNKRPAPQPHTPVIQTSRKKVKVEDSSLINLIKEQPTQKESQEFIANVKEILQEDPEQVNRIGAWRQAPLGFAVRKGLAACVEILIQAKADVNLKNSMGNTAMHAAAHSTYATNSRIINALIYANAGLREENNNRLTPITMAERSNRTNALHNIQFYSIKFDRSKIKLFLLGIEIPKKEDKNTNNKNNHKQNSQKPTKHPPAIRSFSASNIFDPNVLRIISSYFCTFPTRKKLQNNN